MCAEEAQSKKNLKKCEIDISYYPVHSIVMQKHSYRKLCSPWDLYHHIPKYDNCLKLHQDTKRMLSNIENVKETPTLQRKLHQTAGQNNSLSNILH